MGWDMLRVVNIYGHKKLNQFYDHSKLNSWNYIWTLVLCFLLYVLKSGSLLCVQNVLHSNQLQMASIPGSSPRLCPSRASDSMIYPKPTILLQLAVNHFAFAFGLVTLIFAILGTQGVYVTIPLLLIMVDWEKCSVNSWEGHLFRLTKEIFLQETSNNGKRWV